MLPYVARDTPVIANFPLLYAIRIANGEGEVSGHASTLPSASISDSLILAVL
jgi:hypothetical protein